MEDRLTAMRSRVDDRSITAVQPQQTSNFGNRQQKVTAQGRIVFCQFVQRRNRLFRNQQNMHRGLRIYVAKSEAMTVFVDNVGRDLTLNNFQENRHSISHCCRQFCLFRAESSGTNSPPIPVSSDFQARRYQELPETPVIHKALRASKHAVPAVTLRHQPSRILIDRSLPASNRFATP